MKKLFTLKSVLYYCLLTVLMQTQIAQAQWSNDAHENNCVTNALKDQKRNYIVNDGLNNFIIGFRNLEFTSNTMIGGKIYAQKFNANGVVQWAENGIRINASASDDGHDAPQIIKSENGNVIFVWLKWGTNFTAPTHLYARKTGEDGSGIWTGDVKLFNRPGGQGLQSIAADNHNGVVVTCAYSASSGWAAQKDIIAQRIDTEGHIRWSSEGVDVCSATGNQLYPRIATNPDGDIFIAWRDPRDDTAGDIYAQKIDSLGTIKWTNNGIAVCNNSNGQEYPVLIPDNDGGIIVAWVDKNTNSKMGIRMQRINKNGNLLWDSNGILICNNTIFYPPSIVSDNTGGAIIAWPDTRGSDIDIYAQRIDADGIIKWTADGVAVSTATGNQTNTVAIPDGTGGIIIAWPDYRNDVNFSDIYAQRLSHEGIPLWTINGVAVSSAPGNQETPVIASDGDEGVVIAWDDSRNGSTNYDIYIQKIDKNGNLGGVPSLIRQGAGVSLPVSVYPNPVKDDLYLNFNDLPKGKIIIRLFSADGSLVKETEYGNKRLVDIPVSELKKGIYILEVKNMNINFQTKIVKQ